MVWRDIILPIPTDLGEKVDVSQHTHKHTHSGFVYSLPCLLTDGEDKVSIDVGRRGG